MSGELPTHRVTATVGMPIEMLQGVRQTASMPTEWSGPFAYILIRAGATASSLGIASIHEPYHPEHHRGDVVANGTAFAVLVLAVAVMIRSRSRSSN